jgi:hypothetical protein
VALEWDVQAVTERGQLGVDACDDARWLMENPERTRDREKGVPVLHEGRASADRAHTIDLTEAARR